MSKRLKPIMDMALGTLSSRILGLLRDMFLFAALGASFYNSAFIFAFTFPNLFRRLWGEGALTSAFVPVFAQKWIQSSRTESFHFLNLFLTRFLLFLLIVCGMLMAILWVTSFSIGLNEQWKLGLQLSVILMPYMVCICFSAILNATLNVLNSFKIGAFSPLFLNIVMILSLGLGYALQWTASKQVWVLCLSVLLGGILQCLWPFKVLKSKSQWNPEWVVANKKNALSSFELQKLWSLFWPALLGAAVYQINIFVGRTLAFGLNESAASVLYLANRFVELPLGVFSAAITTVVLPGLSLMVAEKRWDDVGSFYREGLTLMITLLLPAAIGLYILGEPLLNLFFAWGHFSQADLKLTLPVLKIFALALPFYGVSSLMIRSFHAQQNTRTPVQIAAWTLISHFLLACTLMHIFKTVGLALASTLATLLQTWLLHKNLNRKNFLHYLKRWLFAGTVMAIGTKSLMSLLIEPGENKLLSMMHIGFIVFVAMALYGIGLLLLDRKTALLWFRLVFRRNSSQVAN